jgi:hypothetical protein
MFTYRAHDRAQGDEQMFTPQVHELVHGRTERFVVRFYKSDGTRVPSGKLQANTYLRADVNGRIRALALSDEHGEEIVHKVIDVVTR